VENKLAWFLCILFHPMANLEVTQEMAHVITLWSFQLPGSLSEQVEQNLIDSYLQPHLEV
jgi:hypothetical protein